MLILKRQISSEIPREPGGESCACQGWVALCYPLMGNYLVRSGFKAVAQLKRFPAFYGKAALGSEPLRKFLSYAQLDAKHTKIVTITTYAPFYNSTLLRSIYFALAAWDPLS